MLMKFFLKYRKKYQGKVLKFKLKIMEYSWNFVFVFEWEPYRAEINSIIKTLVFS